jgi:hypothetical protein
MHQQNLAKLENEAKKAELGAMGRAVGASGNVAGRYLSGEAAKAAAQTAAAQRLESSKINAASRAGIAGLRGAGKAPPTPVDMVSLIKERDALVKALAKPSLVADKADLAEKQQRVNEIERQLKEFGTTGKRSTEEPAPAATGPVKIANDAEYNALASGTTFIGPDGKTRRKP